MRSINQININRYIEKIAFLSIYLAACFSPLFVISKLLCILFPGDCAGSAGGLVLTYALFLAPIIFTVSNIFTISLQKKIKIKIKKIQVYTFAVWNDYCKYYIVSNAYIEFENLKSVKLCK